MTRIRPSIHSALYAGLFASLILPSAGVSGQERTLGEPTGVHPQDFAVVNSVRELSDGRVMIADPLSRVFVLISADLARSDTLGRLGGGPEEYQQPDAVWPLPGDSTLLVDLGNSRLTSVGPDGGFGPTRPIAQGSGGPMSPPTIALPAGVDGDGRIYFRGMPSMGPTGPADSVPVFRLDPDGSSDAVVTVKSQSFTRTTSGTANNQNVSISPIPLSATDVWAVGADGSIAIARVGGSNVQWIRPGGALVQGPQVEVADVPIRQAEKEEWAADRESSGGGVGIEMTMENGSRTMRMARGMADGGPNLDAMTWPDAKAPWVQGAGLVDPEGHFWVRRSLPAGEPALYDVFDGEGGRVDAVRLPEGRTLVGFGSESVYLVHIDAFDLKTLERYARPNF